MSRLQRLDYDSHREKEVSAAGRAEPYEQKMGSHVVLSSARRSLKCRRENEEGTLYSSGTECVLFKASIAPII